VVLSDEASEVVVNDPSLVQRLSTPLKRVFGDAVGPTEPTSASEDFGVYGRATGAPSVQLRIGASDPAEWAKAKEAGTLPPGPHNAGFAPVREPTIRAGVSALTVSVLELLGKPREQG
jgi:hippurate hydrolase